MPKSDRLLAAFLALFFGGLAALGHATPRLQTTVQPTAPNEGDYRVGIATNCVSTSWNVVVSSQPNRRVALVHGLTANSAGVCISSGPQGTCADTTFGSELEGNASLSIYDEDPIYCRSRSGTQILKGHESYDTRD